MIYILGSINADLVVYSERFPEPGETIVGTDFLLNQGGKGANQAIAAKKAGGEVFFIGRVGKDYFGEFVLNSLSKNEVKFSVKKEENIPTGVALINVNAKGENKIIITHGANGKVNGEELSFIKQRISGSDILLLQGEIAPKILVESAKIAKASKAMVIFDPAPVSDELKSVIPFTDFITPNEVEVEALTGGKGAETLFSMGARAIIEKLGSKGVRYISRDEEFTLPAFEVEAVDTTAAGDTFNGAFAAALSNKKSVKESLIFASAAAAISVTRKGASLSSPKKAEIEKFLLRREK